MLLFFLPRHARIIGMNIRICEIQTIIVVELGKKFSLTNYNSKCARVHYDSYEKLFVFVVFIYFQIHIVGGRERERDMILL